MSSAVRVPGGREPARWWERAGLSGARAAGAPAATAVPSRAGPGRALGWQQPSGGTQSVTQKPHFDRNRNEHGLQVS